MKKLSFAAVTAATLVALYGCGDSNSTSADPTPQSSAAVESSSAVIPEEPSVLSSSSVTDTPANPEVSSSSATKNPSVGEVACGDLWCGKTDTEGRVITGSPDETSGYWYLYDDNTYKPMNGNSHDGNSHDGNSHSHILFQLDVDNGYENFFVPFIERDLGIKASVAIENDDEYHYAGWGFNIVSIHQEGDDITDWGGLCLVYSSTAPFEIRIDVENQTEAMGNEHYSASVPASETQTAVNLPWEKFRLPYGSPNKPENVLKNAAAVKLHFEQSGDFFLKSVGREGTCPAVVVPESSSSSVKSSSSTESTGELKASFLWKGDDTEGRVITGSPDETSGYWYYYDDNYYPNNGNSKIVFPSDVEEDEEGNFFGPLNVKYGGIKADIQIGPAYENGFVGLGFNIWSENQEGVDITKWEGVCLTYSSAESFAVQLRVEDEATTTEYCSLQWIVPKSDELTTVSYPWSKLYSSCGWGGFSIDKDRYLQKVSSITLKFSKSGEFLLKEIGSLDACGK